MSIDATAAALLRKEFPPEAIGQLPKPYKADSPKGKCEDCGGWHGLPAMHLDYVGHAATTDRLLQVDPEWTWEPMATDDHGLPMRDDGKNLWIRLTVCGVTRIGVGDGKSAKECIGDAIRNAAMRFGVALDLWSKEELEQGSGTTRRTRAARKAAEAQPDEPTEGTVRMSRPARTKTPRQSQEAKMFVLLEETGRKDKADALTYISKVTGREVDTHRNDLSDEELASVIAELQLEKAGPPPDDAWATGSLPIETT